MGKAKSLKQKRELAAELSGHQPFSPSDYQTMFKNSQRTEVSILTLVDHGGALPEESSTLRRVMPKNRRKTRQWQQSWISWTTEVPVRVISPCTWVCTWMHFYVHISVMHVCMNVEASRRFSIARQTAV